MRCEKLPSEQVVVPPVVWQSTLCANAGPVKPAAIVPAINDFFIFHSSSEARSRSRIAASTSLLTTSPVEQQSRFGFTLDNIVPNERERNMKDKERMQQSARRGGETVSNFAPGGRQRQNIRRISMRINFPSDSRTGRPPKK
jgi:hypothetical protein